jgi:DNA-binding transcriptional LysR family regulator
MLKKHTYKEIRYQQLRGFCETARLGSMAAAAEALGLSQPTVWEQVHALERELDARLVEPHGRGCRLTEAGRLLHELLAPLVAGIDGLSRNFEEVRTQKDIWLTIASTQRVFVEDLSEPIVAFRRSYPHVRLRFQEVQNDEIIPAIEAGKADLGITNRKLSESAAPRIVMVPGYELEILLVTPKRHPLTRRKQVRPQDLKPYPILNAPDGGYTNVSIWDALDRLGVLAQPRPVEAHYSAVFRRYVELGFGIALVPGLGGVPSSPLLHERPMSRYFGKVPMNLAWRKGTPAEGPLASFVQTIRSVLGGNSRGKASR